LWQTHGMRFRPFALTSIWRKKSVEEAREHAEKIKAKAEARKSIQGLLTPSQEELRKELGLHPDGYEKAEQGKPVKKRKTPNQTSEGPSARTWSREETRF